MRYKHFSITLLTAGWLLASGYTWAQTGSANRMKHEAGANPDHAFMTAAAQGGTAEVELGKLAKDHGSNDAVKNFGQHMIDDHSKANDELKDLASKKGVTLPTSL